MLPASQATEEELERKRIAFDDLRCTTHWPLAAKVHDKLAERDGARDPLDKGVPRQKPVLDDAGLKLAGVKPYH